MAAGNLRRIPAMVLPLVLGLAAGVHADGRFQRGDVDGDGRLTVTDAIHLLSHLFGGRNGGALSCADAADADDSGTLDITDAVRLLTRLFLGGPPLPSPRDRCGVDPTADPLSCESCESCGTCPSFLHNVLAGREAFVLVVDRSGSMVDSGELARVKNAILDILCVLGEDRECAAIFFDRGVVRWPPAGPPVPLTPENRAELSRFVQSIPGGSGTCPLPALLLALEILSQAKGTNRAILLVSDGGCLCLGGDEGACWQETLARVEAANGDRIPILTP